MFWSDPEQLENYGFTSLFSTLSGRQIYLKLLITLLPYSLFSKASTPHPNHLLLGEGMKNGLLRKCKEKPEGGFSAPNPAIFCLNTNLTSLLLIFYV